MFFWHEPNNIERRRFIIRILPKRQIRPQHGNRMRSIRDVTRQRQGKLKPPIRLGNDSRSQNRAVIPNSIQVNRQRLFWFAGVTDQIQGPIWEDIGRGGGNVEPVHEPQSRSAPITNQNSEASLSTWCDGAPFVGSGCGSDGDVRANLKNAVVEIGVGKGAEFCAIEGDFERLLTIKAPVCADEEDISAGTDLSEGGAEFGDNDSFGEMGTGGGEDLFVRKGLARVILRRRRAH
jgi:hypothetical protein